MHAGPRARDGAAGHCGPAISAGQRAGPARLSRVSCQAFRACIEADPRRIDAFNNLDCCRRRYDYDAAAAEFRNGLAVSESAELLLNLGVAVEHAGDMQEAQRGATRRVITLAPTGCATARPNLGALAATREARWTKQSRATEEPWT